MSYWSTGDNNCERCYHNHEYANGLSCNCNCHDSGNLRWETSTKVGEK